MELTQQSDRFNAKILKMCMFVISSALRTIDEQKKNNRKIEKKE